MIGTGQEISHVDVMMLISLEGKARLRPLQNSGPC